MLKGYGEYKEINLPWLKAIPSHWDTRRAKSIFIPINERSQKGEEELLSVSSKFGVVKRKNAAVTMFKAESYENYKLCWENDLVINSLWAWQTGLGFSPYHGIISTAYSVFRLKNSDNNYKYFHYLLRGIDFQWELQVRSKGIWRSRYQLSDNEFFDSPMILPPRSEQDQIVRYLDGKVSMIYKYIKGKKRQIELLKERKQALINRAVTKGLDPKVPMKDSSIEWLGKIPAHWEVNKLRHFCQLQNGISESGTFFLIGTPFVSYSDVYRNYQLPSKVEGVAAANEKQQEIYSVKKGDVFFTRTSETIDEIAYSSVCFNDIDKAVFSGFLIRVRQRVEKLDLYFAKYFFRSVLLRDYFCREMNLVTRVSLGQTLLQDLSVILPPMEEQMRIGKYLEYTNGMIDGLIERYEDEIIKVAEYRTRLVSDVVTGKIDIQNEKIPNFDARKDDQFCDGKEGFI
jgi:type I restriction enzyme S subunit